MLNRRLGKKRRLPTLPLLRSTIGVTRLNFCSEWEEVEPQCYSHLKKVDMLNAK